MRSSFHYSKIVLLFFLIVALTAQEKEEKVLATAGSKKITVDEFLKRYELTPHLKRNVEDGDQYVKTELLYTIIAEKLWAQEAEAEGYDTADIMRNTFVNLEKMYVRDALYTNEIKNNVNITPEQWREAFRRNAYELDAYYIFSFDENKINEIYDQLLGGVPFDSILIARPEYQLQSEPYKIEYGKMEEFVEDTLFNLKAGDFSVPLKSDHGWYIFKIASINQKIITDARQASGEDKRVRKELDARETDKVYNEYFTNFFGDKKVRTNGYLFWSFADKVISIMNRKKQEPKVPDNTKITLSPEDYYEIEGSIGADTLDMIFIELEKDPITLKGFLRSFAYEGFYSTTTDPDTLSAKLNARVKRFIEQELLAREGYSKGLQDLPEVKSSVAMWRDNYLANLYKQDLLGSVAVTEEEVKDYFTERAKSGGAVKQVNILEILTDSLAVIEDVLNQLESGADFRRLASLHTKREWTRRNGGEFGFFPVDLYGEIGRIAGGMEIGDIYGPVKVEGGYSIFKLIDVKEEAVTSYKPFDEVKDELASQLKYEKFNDLRIQRTVELANKYGVSVDLSALYSLEATNFSMLAFKLFGFGGQSLAVPLSVPFIEWVEKWQKSQKALP